MMASSIPYALAGLELRRLGEYGHFVAPLSRIAADVQEFTGLPVLDYLSEVQAIERESQGVHPEEAAVLFLIARAAKPQFMLETGTFKGYSTQQIARALQLNGSGRLVTVDLATHTGEMVAAELMPWVTFHRGLASRDFAQTLTDNDSIDVFFHDSLHTFLNTLGELTWFAPHYASDALIVCHDAKMDFMDDFGVGKAVRLFAKRLDLQFCVLDTTCGLALLKWRVGASQQAVRQLQSEVAEMIRLASQPLWRKAWRRVSGW